MKSKQILGYFKIVAISLTAIVVLNYAIGILFLKFGTPFGLLISKYKLDKYSKAVYGEDFISHGLPEYNLKNGGYHYKITTKDTGAVSELEYKVSEDIITDTTFKADFDLQGDIDAIQNQLDKDIYLPKAHIYYGIDGNQDFSQVPLKTIDKLYLTGIINTNVNLTPEESKENFFEITSFIYDKLGNKYNFTSSQIIYMDINGVLETYISSKESKMPYEKMKSKIKQITAGEWDIEFINQLKAVKNGQLSKDKLVIPYKY